MHVLRKGVFVAGVAAAFLTACTDQATGPSVLGSEPAARSAPTLATLDPFVGLDEMGHAAGIGSAEAVDEFLKIISRRLAALTHEESIRSMLVQRVGATDRGAVVLAEVGLANPGFLAQLANGFRAEVAAVGIHGELARAVVPRAKDDNEAILNVAQALFGLKLQFVVPDGSSISAEEPFKVYHNPITDELVTEIYEGFDADGRPVQFDFDMHQIRAPYPFLYVSQDEDYSDGLVSAAVRQVHEHPHPAQRLPSFLGQLLRLGATRACAHDPSGHVACMADNQLSLIRIRIDDDHEGVGNPEIYVNSRVSDGLGLSSGSWPLRSHNTKNDLEDVDSEDQWYPFLYPDSDVLLYEHNGSTCYGGLWNRHDILVREADAWPNPNDDVAAWSGVGVTEADYFYDGTAYSYPGDADIRVVAIEQ